MKPSLLLGLFSALILTACSSVSSRIARNREAFDSYPLAVQEKITRGEVDVGFTEEQVRLAMGDPDRVSTRTTADGVSEVWSYRSKKGRFSVGVGVGVFGGGGSTRVGTGVGVNTGGDRYDDERLRVVFERGQVSAVETVQ